MNPGVASAWTANSAVIVEKAMPIRTLRPSRARAPAMLSASEARLVIAAAALTRPKCIAAGSMYVRVPKRATTATGTSAANRVKARTSRDRVMARVIGSTAEQILTNGKVVLTTS